jgi:hypothetical protein
MAETDTNFWAVLVANGWIQGDPEYYSTGAASETEILNAISVANDAAVAGGEDSIYHYMVNQGYIEGDPGYYSGGSATTAEILNAVSVANDSAGGGGDGSKDAGGGVDIAPGAPKEETTAETGVGGQGADPETALSILTSNEMNWYFDTNTGKWYVGYGLPNSTRELIFEAEPTQMDALFGTGFRPTNFSKTTLKNLTNKTTTTFAGNIAEVEGTGTFEGEIDRVISLALDEGILPEWAKADGAVLDLLFIAQSEGKSNDWLVDQIAKLPSFENRFGKGTIDKLKQDGNLTTTEAIAGYLEFEAGVKMAAKTYSGGAGTEVPNETVQALLAKGHSLTTVNTTFSMFDRMTKYAPALTAFNDVLAATGNDTISTLQGMLDFVGGTAAPELYELWEASSISEAAAEAGLGEYLSAEEAINTAIYTSEDFTNESATAAMQKAAETLLRLRAEVEVGRFGLTHEDLIDIQLGMPIRSGVPQSEIFQNIQRAVNTAERKIGTKSATPFFGFTSDGAIKSSSLENLNSNG